MFIIGVIYKVATYADALVDPQTLSLPHPALYSFARFSVWALYGFWTGLFATGLWVKLKLSCSNFEGLIGHFNRWWLTKLDIRLSLNLKPSTTLLVGSFTLRKSPVFPKRLRY
jgi:hypothetical protein